MNKLVRDIYHSKALEILSWYEEVNLTQNRNYLFVKDIIDDCLISGKRSMTDKMVSYLDSIYEAGKPQSADKELLESITIHKNLQICSSAQNNILSSLELQCQSGRSLSEKQINLAKKIISEIKDSLEKGFWDITEDQKDELFIILKLSKSYSGYYLNNYSRALLKSLDLLNSTVVPRLISGEKLTQDCRLAFEYVKLKMKTKLHEYRNPKFKPGEIAYSGNGNRICTIISGYGISETGNLTYDIMENLQISTVYYASIKNKPNFGTQWQKKI